MRPCVAYKIEVRRWEGEKLLVSGLQSNFYY